MKKLFFLALIGHVCLLNVCNSVPIGQKTKNENMQAMAQKEVEGEQVNAQTDAEFIVHPI